MVKKKLIFNPITQKSQKLDPYGKAAQKIYQYRIEKLNDDSNDVLRFVPKLIYRSGDFIKLDETPINYLRKIIKPQITTAEQSDNGYEIQLDMDKMNDKIDDLLKLIRPIGDKLYYLKSAGGRV